MVDKSALYTALGYLLVSAIDLKKLMAAVVWASPAISLITRRCSANSTLNDYNIVMESGRGTVLTSAANGEHHLQQLELNSYSLAPPFASLGEF